MTHMILLRHIAGTLAVTGLMLAAPAMSLKAQLINRIVDLADFEAHTAHGDFDKCGPVDEKMLERAKLLLGDGWGYGYDRLLTDIEVWRKSPYVAVGTIGKTVQGREIWELTVTSPERPDEPRHTVTIHARTHPHETQSWWVCEQIIRFLLSDDPFADLLRRECTFHIIPMYNPDGVEMTTTRYNANGVDLEREWDKPAPQPEAAALKRRFDELMNSEAPIEIALNLHSSSDPERYFWFHDETGTSPEFATLERDFIAGVRTWFMRIRPWNYRVSWIESTPTHFPESWFWFNFGTEVMALTYEDIFSHDTADADAHFDSTAMALLRGVADYLNLQMPSGVADDGFAGGMTLAVSADEPGRIRFSLPAAAPTTVTVHDPLGRTIARPVDRMMGAGAHEIAWRSEDVPSGTYFVRLQSRDASLVSRVVIVR